MNADGLVEFYERIVDAPDAIDRLRELILALAVRGKLVSQDRNDEPSSELLKRIAAEKARLTKEGNIGKGKPLPPLPRSGLAFDIPYGWTWVRLGELSKLVTSGSRDWAKHYSQEGAIFVRMGNLSKGHYRLRLDNIQRVSAPPDGEGTRTRLEAGDILISITGDVGMLGLIPEGFGEAYINQHTAVIRLMPEMKGRFLAELFRSPFAQTQFNAPQRGIKNSFRLTDITQFIVPLPPLAEQKRIVAKVDELMALCDQLEKSQTIREETRDRLTAASFARLNDPDPETFRADTRFVLDVLPSMTARPDQIKQLRQTILNLAVRGNLVPQNTKDEPAQDLLQRVARENGATKRAVLSFGVEDQPFVIPDSWVWSTLGQLIVLGPQNGISPRPTKREDAPKAITLTATTSGNFNPSYFKRVEASIPPNSDFWLTEGDLLFQRGNTREYVGMAAVYRGPPSTFLFPDLMMRVRVSNTVNLRFVHLASVSPPARTFFSTNASGAQSTMPKINQTTLVSLPIPLPPLAEQERIVTKVDELMALCDRLEATLTTGETARSRLLEALLHEALEPLADQLEAAA